ncbi:MAG: hypothetical protein ACE5IM_03370, partial [Nitrospinota bacterium]
MKRSPARNRLLVIATLAPLAAALLLTGCSSVALNRLTPSNVSATVRPDVRKYDLRNIAVMPFRNNTDSPDAGNKVARFFYDEIASRKTYTVSPP